MSVDSDIVVWINGHHNAFLDELMWIISYPFTWIPLYVLLLVLLWFKLRNWRQFIIVLIGFVIAVGLSDFISSGLLKPIVCRLRPTYEITSLHLVHDYRGGLYGFCSSHAANSMAVAMLFSLIYRKKIVTALMMLWVTIVCYSRLYLGVHYPTDIIGGLFVGCLLAAVVWLALLIVFHVGDEEFLTGDS